MGAQVASRMEVSEATFPRIIQVVSASHSTAVASASATWIATDLTATITPTSATSTILVIVFQNGVRRGAGNSDELVAIRLVRDSTTLATFEQEVGYSASSLMQSVGSAGVTWVDSPATTSATTYKTEFNGGGTGVTSQVQAASATSTIVLLEVAA